MVCLKNRGIVDLPVVIILDIFLASLALGIGMEGLNRTKALEGKHKSIRSFDRLVEKSSKLSYGEVNEKRRISLELGGGKITVRGNLIQLEKKDEILRSEYLPLPLQKGGEKNPTIRSGNFLIELINSSRNREDGNSQDLVLELTEINCSHLIKE